MGDAFPPLPMDVKIQNPTDDTKRVTTTTDGLKERLDISLEGEEINVTVSNDESPTKFQLKTSYNVVGTSVTTSDTTLYTYTGSGLIDLVAVTSAVSSNWGVIIFIDGTERLRITMASLGTILGLTDSNFDIAAQTANKQFRWRPTTIGFATSFTIKAYATSGTVTLYNLILFREKVVT
jgi:uncharacterized protein with LGFP repeats